MFSDLPPLWNQLRTSRWAAPIAPLASFLILQSLAGFFRVEDDSTAPWWQAHPEHWIYPLQTVVAIALLVFWWRQYEFTRLRPGQIAWAATVAAIGFSAWIAPDALGWTKRGEGFDPYALGREPKLVACILIFRFTRLVIVAALVEEIFWRGFLQRYLVDTSRDFWSIPLGTFTWRSAIWTTAGVVLIHAPADWPAALIWGVLLAFLYVRTGSLSACVLTHAMANLFLGVYVIQTGAWGFW